MQRAAPTHNNIRRRRAVAWACFALAQCILLATLIGLTISVTAPGVSAQSSSVRPPDSAVQNATPTGAAGATVPRRATGRTHDSVDPTEGPTGGQVPGNTSGLRSDADLWRYVRGIESPNFDATTSLPNKQSRVLVQPFGEKWREVRNGPLPKYGAYALAGIVGLLALFFLLRGRIRIEAGRSGETIERFSGVERFGHWLLATSFIVLALTGLNITYGRSTLLPLIGPEAFSTISLAGKWLHNNIAWTFMLALVLIFVMWVVHNIPSWTDLKWLAKGGGLFSKGVHPDARKFNAGQKILFWSIIVLGVSISLSGIALLFPFETQMMGKTFNILHALGLDVPTSVTPMQEMQYQTIWHAIIAIAMTVVVLAHIYIGSIGMEGAFAAMGSGQVDTNWAREHHNLWAAEKLGEAPHRPEHGDQHRDDDHRSAPGASPAPAPAE